MSPLIVSAVVARCCPVCLRLAFSGSALGRSLLTQLSGGDRSARRRTASGTKLDAATVVLCSALGSARLSASAAASVCCSLSVRRDDDGARCGCGGDANDPIRSPRTHGKHEHASLQRTQPARRRSGMRSLGAHSGTVVDACSYTAARTREHTGHCAGTVLDPRMARGDGRLARGRQRPATRTQRSRTRHSASHTLQARCPLVSSRNRTATVPCRCCGEQ